VLLSYYEKIGYRKREKVKKNLYTQYY